MSGPVNSLINGSILVFEVVADSYDETDPKMPTEKIIQAQAQALRLAQEPTDPD
ncbi:hypothetical protein ABZY44_25195 [Streptomyces sp. NPDC006544]|uniref:hypothetical protein n=1 Tax=Streptomyces sp. NPDC006544 TaxID=3154583 RepID=UPI0033A24171